MATENKNLSTYDKNQLPSAKPYSFGIVFSEWNGEITQALKQGALTTLYDLGAEVENIEVLAVPGSFELVYGARKMAKNFDAIIAIGCVIRGETPHFDYVCRGVTQGISTLNATQDTPIVFCVLTDDTIAQSRDRAGGRHGNKGVEAAIVALKMAEIRYKG